MTWEGEPQFRWSRMYKGTRFRVNCEQLGLSRNQWTKELSASAANTWWDKKLSECQAAALALHPNADLVKELTARLNYATRHGQHADAENIDAEIVRVQQLPAADPDAVPDIDTDTARRLEGLRAVGLELPADPVVLRLLNPTDAVWGDRLKREKDTPKERTVGALAQRWLDERRDEARKGTRSIESAESLRWCLDKYQQHVGAAANIDSVTADVWHRWFVYCAGQVAKRDAADNDGWSADTAQKIFTTSRTFVKWCWEREVLDALPRNLTSRQHRFERPQKAIPTFSNDEIKTLVSAAKGVHRLILLLMLNCGMTQKDVSDLKKSQTDLKAGRITRRRSKTLKQKASRLVSYKLWPEVVALLEAHTNADAHEPRALVTKSGKPWVWTELTTADKKKKSDNVATVFNKLKQTIKMTGEGKSLKVFRKTSATMLKRKAEYRDLRFLFLGHSEQTVADRRYAESSQTLLDEAVNWLRTEYKVDKLDEATN